MKFGYTIEAGSKVIFLYWIFVVVFLKYINVLGQIIPQNHQVFIIEISMKNAWVKTIGTCESTLTSAVLQIKFYLRIIYGAKMNVLINQIGINRAIHVLN